MITKCLLFVFLEEASSIQKGNERISTTCLESKDKQPSVRVTNPTPVSFPSWIVGSFFRCPRGMKAKLLPEDNAVRKDRTPAFPGWPNKCRQGPDAGACPRLRWDLGPAPHCGSWITGSGLGSKSISVFTAAAQRNKSLPAGQPQGVCSPDGRRAAPAAGTSAHPGRDLPGRCGSRPVPGGDTRRA